jgi:hypothetical protein
VETFVRCKSNHQPTTTNHLIKQARTSGPASALRKNGPSLRRWPFQFRPMCHFLMLSYDSACRPRVLDRDRLPVGSHSTQKMMLDICWTQAEAEELSH